MKKTVRIMAFALMATCLLSSCSSAQDTPVQLPISIAAKNILIVYLSRTGNTEAIAQIIHRQVGGTLVDLELENPYPQDYKMTVDQVAKENETGYLPPLKTAIKNIETYDLVFVGFPTWGMQLPPPMKSFLHHHTLSGKTIIPFNTNAGYGIGNSFSTVRELCPNSQVLEGYSLKGGVERDGVLFVLEGEKARKADTEVGRWLRKIGIIK